MKEIKNKIEMQHWINKSANERINAEKLSSSNVHLSLLAVSSNYNIHVSLRSYKYIYLRYNKAAYIWLWFNRNITSPLKPNHIHNKHVNWRRSVWEKLPIRYHWKIKLLGIEPHIVLRYIVIKEQYSKTYSP